MIDYIGDFSGTSNGLLPLIRTADTEFLAQEQERNTYNHIKPKTQPCLLSSPRVYIQLHAQRMSGKVCRDSGRARLLL